MANVFFKVLSPKTTIKFNDKNVFQYILPSERASDYAEKRF